MTVKNFGIPFLVIFSILFLLCIPVSAYSAEATRLYDQGNALGTVEELYLCQ